MRRIVSIFFTWRFLLLVPLLIGYFLIPYRAGYDYTDIWKFIHHYNPVSSFLLYPWANFDGVYYLMIAGNGYTSNAGFFPLFPIIIHVVSSLFGKIQTFGGIEFFVGLFLSNIFFFFSLVIFYKLLRLDYDNKIAYRSILFLLLFPTAFFFVSIYTESLFLLLTLLAFFHARRKEWLQAGILGLLLSATRLVGIAIFPVLLFEFLTLAKEKLSLKILPIFLVPLGLMGYVLFNINKWGDVFYFIKAQGMLANNRSVDSIILFPQTIFRYFKILLIGNFYQYEYWVAVLELTTFFIVSILLYIAWKNKVRLSYTIFSILCFLIPISTGTFSGLPRYVVVLFPIFIGIALIKNKNIQFAYVIISSILLFVLLMLFSRGYFVA